MRILLTNDDGITAPGLAALYRELVALGNVVVVAPLTVQSATSHAITVSTPLVATRVDVGGLFTGWAVNGRPADCVKLAIAVLLKEKPDLVVSGINDGANVSVNVLYSGTVAAAAEGAIGGIPAVAVSREWGEDLNFGPAARIAGKLVGRYAESVRAGRPICPLLNINIPNVTNGRPMGVIVAPQAVLKSEDRYERTQCVDGGVGYSLRGWFDDHGPAHLDLGAMKCGDVVLTPLHVDMTDHASLRAVADCDWPTIHD